MLRPWQLLLVRIRKIYEEHPDNRNYGVGRILLALEQRGVHASRSTVRRAMKKGGLLKAPARKPDEGGRCGAKGGEPDPPGLYCGGAQSEMADRHYAGPVLGREALPCCRAGLL